MNDRNHPKVEMKKKKKSVFGGIRKKYNKSKNIGQQQMKQKTNFQHAIEYWKI